MNRFFWERTGGVYVTANVVLRSLVERVVEALGKLHSRWASLMTISSQPIFRDLYARLPVHSLRFCSPVPRGSWWPIQKWIHAPLGSPLSSLRCECPTGRRLALWNWRLSDDGSHWPRGHAVHPKRLWLEVHLSSPHSGICLGVTEGNEITPRINNAEAQRLEELAPDPKPI